MKRLIASDIDGVIAEFVVPFTSYINQKLGTNCDHNEQHHVDIAKSYGLEGHVVEKLHDNFIAEGHYANLPLVEGAIEALKTLNKKHDIVLITSRRPDLELVTKEWCGRHLPEAHLHFGRGRGNVFAGSDGRLHKEDIAKELGAFCLIEDNPFEFLTWSEPAVQPICFARLQNAFLAESHNHIPRMTWPGIVSYLQS